MNIGITERGDAGIDLSWFPKLSRVDGCILITKNLTDACIEKIKESPKPIILHCTCTGWGGTIMEPNVPVYEEQFRQLEKLLEQGFNPERVVLRLDPIIPNMQGLEKADQVLTRLETLNNWYKSFSEQPITRVRISILDEYKYVKQRFYEAGLDSVYGDDFYPQEEQIKAVAELLKKHPGFTYESCAEPILAKYTDCVTATGCVSQKDLQLMGLSYDQSAVNGQGRYGCLCLRCKTELLTNRHRCPHQCLYCYWKD